MASTFVDADHILHRGQLPALDSITKFLNTLQTEPLLLRMGIRKHNCKKNCRRNMLQAYVGQLPNGTVRTSACYRRIACKIQCKQFAVYLQYTAVY